MEQVRQQKFEKIPGIAETVDWAKALVALHRNHLDTELIKETLGVVFKDWSDVRQMQQSLPEFLASLGIRANTPPTQQAQPPVDDDATSR